MITHKNVERIRIKVFGNADFIDVDNIEAHSWALKVGYLDSDLIKNADRRLGISDDLWFGDSVQELMCNLHRAYRYVDESRSYGMKHRLVLETYIEGDSEDLPCMSFDKKWSLNTSD